MNKTTNKQALVNIATTVYDYFQNAKENLSHACDSHEASYGEGQCEIMEKLVETIYSFISKTTNGDELMKEIHAHEDKAEKFKEKAQIIIEASNYEVSFGYEDDEYFIKTTIEKLEANGIEIAMKNFDKIVEYINNK